MSTEVVKPTLEMLIDALEAQMPSKFTWDFRTVLRREKCDSIGCAVGLAYVLWGKTHPSRWHCWDEDDVAKIFDMPIEHVDDIFYDVEIHGVDSHDWDSVTPRMVAATLRRYIANGRQLPLPEVQNDDY